MKKRVYIYDNFKFLLILLVVLGHSLEPYLDISPVFKGTFIFIYSFHMPAFIFVSGLFAKKAIGDSRRCRDRMLYFLILYLVLKLIRSCMRFCFSGTFHFRLFWEDGIPWFLFVMAAYYGLTRFFRAFPKRPLLAASILLACLFGYDSSMTDYLCISRCVVFYPFFLAGYYLDPAQVTEMVRPALRKFAGGLCILLLLAISFLRTDSIYQFRRLFTGHNPYTALADTLIIGDTAWKYGGLFRLLYYPIVFLFIFALLALMPDRKLPAVSRIGSRTLSIYFWHLLLLSVLRTTQLYPLIHSFFPGAYGLPVHLLFSFLLCLFFSLKIWSVPFQWVEALLAKLPAA